MTAILSSGYQSSLSLTDGLRRSVQRLQGDLTTAQTELASGTLADPGLTLGARSGAIATITAHQSALTTLAGTNAIAATRLDSSQTALKTALAGSQGFLGALISQSGIAAEPSVAGTQATAALKTLTGVLNTTVDGEFIFGGINSGQKPIADYPGAPPGAAKTAFDTAFQSAFGVLPSDPAAASITPAAIGSFIDTQFAALYDPAQFSANVSSASDTVPESTIAEGETAVTGASANAPGFRKLFAAYTLVGELSTGTLSAAAYRTVLDKATATISAATPGLTDISTALGLSQQRVSDADDRLSLQQDTLKKALGSLQDVDTYALSNRISTLTTQIETAYSLTSKLHQLSLLNYI